MPRKRSWRDVEEEEPQKAIIISDDDEDDANADLSMTILAKAFRRSPLLGGVVLSDDDQREAAISVPSLPTKLPSPFPSPSSDLAPQQPRPAKKQKSKIKKKKKKASETEAEQNQLGNAEKNTLIKIIGDDEEDNVEMRQLSRGPRYFDPPDTLCFRCGNIGHFAVNCTEEARKKACFVCGGLDHEVKDCPQSSCLICQSTGHFSKMCPNKGTYNHRSRDRGNFCLRCGHVGHEMTSCDREYEPEDLQGIQCYVCKEYGHLCCVDVALTSGRQDTCYNCGEPGHTGMGCAKSRGQVERSGSVCYRCGEEGHFARGCSKRDEDDSWDDFGTPATGIQPPANGFQGFRSVPAVVEARRRIRKSDFYERRVNTPPVRWPERWNMEEGERWNRSGQAGESGKIIQQRQTFLEKTAKPVGCLCRSNQAAAGTYCGGADLTKTIEQSSNLCGCTFRPFSLLLLDNWYPVSIGETPSYIDKCNHNVTALA
ncbi:hypothetical protein GOP47_0009799 [Adiantum capillus-veneris]|uniref:CCHC-type domain-containing protein n=1 Tax=Adiantum capillus-veneris TaxID=13818 RepID=A0A9D4UY55_ADICA|nr:hypothetical protein GOP47_0009799 [Adiantum capillus-veneris]